MNTEKNTEDKPNLSHIIDYDTDIEPYRFISIFSGVGSGKNYFVNELVKGSVFTHHDGSPIEKKAILLVTSRRSKVNEMLRSAHAFYASRVYEDSSMIWYANEEEAKVYECCREWVRVGDPKSIYSWEVPKHSVAHTNARIETNLQWSFVLENPLAKPWDRFDMIVVDEVHSLLTDASYQSAPYYVMRLIEETLKCSETCKVIVMTGTPDVLKRHPLFEQAHVIDAMDTCVSIAPKRVEFISDECAQKMQREMLARNEKFVAFYNHVDSILKLGREEPEKTVMSFSKEEVRNGLEKDTLNRIEAVEEYLAEKEQLPEEVIGFLTTARNKEGISIKNKDIHVMFTEAHTETDVIQMAGRVRNPIDVLYVVVDSKRYWDHESQFEALISKNESVLAGINEEFRKLCVKNGYPLEADEYELMPAVCKNEQLKAYLDFIHKKYPYIRFDYFTNQFVYYKQREISRQYNYVQNRIFDEAKAWPDQLAALAKKWFPKAECVVRAAMVTAEAKQIHVERYLTRNNWLDGKKEIRQKERKEILEELNRLTGAKARKLKPLLAKYGFDLVANSKSKKNDTLHFIVRKTA